MGQTSEGRERDQDQKKTKMQQKKGSLLPLEGRKSNIGCWLPKFSIHPWEANVYYASFPGGSATQLKLA